MAGRKRRFRADSVLSLVQTSGAIGNGGREWDCRSDLKLKHCGRMIIIHLLSLMSRLELAL